MGIIVFIVWYYLINVMKLDTTIARGYIMALMVFLQNIHVFNCRSEKKSAFDIPLKSNKLILGAFVSSIILQVIVMEVPVLSEFLQTTSVPFVYLVYLFLMACFVLLFVEIYKKIKYKLKD